MLYIRDCVDRCWLAAVRLATAGHQDATDRPPTELPSSAHPQVSVDCDWGQCWHDTAVSGVCSSDVSSFNVILLLLSVMMTTTTSRRQRRQRRRRRRRRRRRWAGWYVLVVIADVALTLHLSSLVISHCLQHVLLLLGVVLYSLSVCSSLSLSGSVYLSLCVRVCVCPGSFVETLMLNVVSFQFDTVFAVIQH